MYVMGYMRLGDAVGEGRRQPSHHRTQVSQQVPIIGCQGASWESKLARTVMWKKGIGVLKECDQDDPVVYPVDEKEGQRWRIEKWKRTYQR